jgi:hypothetical protein
VSPAPVRLRIAYKTAVDALHEVTRNLQRGEVTLETRKAVEVGTQFIFEMYGNGLGVPALVHADVIAVKPAVEGGFFVTLRYSHGTTRDGFELLLRHVYETQRQDTTRRHPRLPLHVRAVEHTQQTTYLVRDLSSGGLGVLVEGNDLPQRVQVGAPFLLEIDLPAGVMPLHGEVSWVASAPGAEEALRPSFGVSFGKLRTQARDTVKKLLLQKNLPPPPWSARVSFGMDAVSRMP